MSEGNETGWSDSAILLSLVGPETKGVIADLYNRDLRLFEEAIEDDELKILADNLRGQGWVDNEVAKLVKSYADELQKNRKIKVSEMCRWVASHKNQADSVLECMRVKPPRDIQIIKVLSRVGSQKSVYLAYWQAQQEQYVAKVVNGPKEVKQTIIARELINHPLSAFHPHPCIIKTYAMQNEDGEIFLIEDCIPEILSDKWEYRGIGEIANLFRDIAHALEFLHDTRQLVHGDVKPDNIGKSERFILLDFGICRSVQDFTPEVTGTGSLRTRAPEVILKNHYGDPRKVDVWALGATIFQACTGRFPLFNQDEKVPRISTPTERAELEEQLRFRIENEWDKYVNYDEINRFDEATNTNIIRLLDRTLEKDPDKRLTSRDLFDEIRETFTALLIPEKEPGSNCSPVEELAQMDKYLNAERIQIMPTHAQWKLSKKLGQIKLSIDKTGNGDHEHYSRMFERVNNLFEKYASTRNS